MAEVGHEPACKAQEDKQVDKLLYCMILKTSLKDAGQKVNISYVVLSLTVSLFY